MKHKIAHLSARGVKAGPDDGLEDGQFRAYASVFGNKDSYGDVVVPGAFAETLAEWAESGNQIPLLFGHNMIDPDFNLGHVAAAEDDRGLLVTGYLDLDNPKAAQVYRMLKGRRINQMSFAYDVIDGSEVTEDGEYAYELRKVKLYEVSVVTIGANQETEILAVKTIADAIADGLKVGRALSTKNETALRDARDAIDAVLASLADDDADKSAHLGGEDQEQASGTPAAKADATDEESSGAKSDVSADEPPIGTSVSTLAAKFNIYATAYAGQEGA